LSGIRENLGRVRDRIEAAAARAGRDPASVGICAVTKLVDLPEIREAVSVGCRILGESRVQDAEPKIEEAKDLAGKVSWHMIGHLQKNKARKAVGLFETIQSVDGLPLARRLSTLGEERGRPVPVFVEVLTSDEGTKSGISLAEVDDAVAEIRELAGIALGGLMTMAPFTSDEEKIRASFTSLREVRDRLGPETLELSMGMTGDYEIAVEEGSTLVRVGTGIFG
jgi:pyridoxal phosphate enzyme (YggS family)